MSALISVQLDAVAALAAELAALATALAEEAPLCTSTATSLSAALGGREGGAAGAAGLGWAARLEGLARRSGTIATTLTGAVAAYRAADAQLSERITGSLGRTAIAR